MARLYNNNNELLGPDVIAGAVLGALHVQAHLILTTTSHAFHLTVGKLRHQRGSCSSKGQIQDGGPSLTPGLLAPSYTAPLEAPAVSPRGAYECNPCW